MDNQIFHICYASEWDKAIQRGAYLGSTQDKKDGFIHFSTKNQISCRNKHLGPIQQLLHSLQGVDFFYNTITNQNHYPEQRR